MKKLLLVAGVGLCVASACSPDNADLPQPTLVGRWQIDNYSIRSFRNGQTTAQEVVTRDSLAACLRDDYTSYAADQTGVEYYGQPCSGGAQAPANFAWQLDGNQLIRTFSNGDRDRMTIAVMTEGYYTALDTLYPSASRPDTGVLMQQFKRIP